eukprot:CAMPEP_0116939328 /NCGR_PEP_ID=MMETSP0467-20121206/32671_1 /TAXON_ID=283647 /ORGANISM="Mesodinium pulex, Strain SPMC105" /LENGTH=67 /DNA_ID=CAMNT_0004621587 /DNA_START=623 /DNA_END=826 /DNA_ORIENTATION=+
MNGQNLMLVSSQSDAKKQQIVVVDPLAQKQLSAMRGIVNEENKYVEAVFSPNSEYVFTGGSDGFMRV